MAAKPYEPLIDVARAAEMMGISPQGVRALVRARQLRAITFSGSGYNPAYRFRPSDIDRAIRKTRNSKGFSSIYAASTWSPPPPRPPRDTSRAGRPRIAFDVARAQELRKQGMRLVDIGREVGVSSTTVANALRFGRSEIYARPGRPAIEFDLEKAIALRRDGASFKRIAAELGGMSSATVSKAVREAAPELSRPQGFRNRDNDAVARMVSMRRGGASYREIGAAFGLEAQAVTGGLRSLGIRMPRIKPLRKQFDVERALQMRRTGLTFAQIGKELGGLAAPTVARGIREHSGLKASLFNFDIKLALKMRRQGQGYVAISKAVGASRPTVTNAIKLRMLFAPPPRQFPPKFDVGKAKAMRAARKSYRAIAEDLGVSTAAVAKYLGKQGGDFKANHGPRFDLALARQLHHEDKSLEEIAAACGVSIHTIRRYLNPPRQRRKKRSAGLEHTADAAESSAPETPSGTEPAP